MSEGRDLKALRQAIDELDDRLLALINERAQLVSEVGQLKATTGGEIFVPAREEAIHQRLAQLHQGPLPYDAVRRIFREILAASKLQQRGVRAAYVGPIASYAHQAAIQHLGNVAQFVPCLSISDVFAAVEQQRADYGVVPVSPPGETLASETLDRFISSPLTIYAEVYLSAEYVLLSRTGRRDAVDTIYAHPQALTHCRRWLELNLPQSELRPSYATTAAAQEARLSDRVAVIGSPLLAHLADLQVVEAGTADEARDTMRFLVVSASAPERSADDITTMLFAIARDQAGALYRALEPFARHGVNLTRVESRRTTLRSWEYLFHVDFAGHATDAALTAAIEELRQICDFARTLGSYPRAPYPAV